MKSTFLGLAIVALIYPPMPGLAQRDLSRVTFKPSTETSVPADPCVNPFGASRRRTWFGTDASAVQEETIVYCTAERTEAVLNERLETGAVVDDRIQPATKSRAAVREVWAQLPDLKEGDVVDESTPTFLYYFRVIGNTLLILSGSDEHHIRRLLVQEQ